MRTRKQMFPHRQYAMIITFSIRVHLVDSARSPSTALHHRASTLPPQTTATEKFNLED